MIYHFGYNFLAEAHSAQACCIEQPGTSISSIYPSGAALAAHQRSTNGAELLHVQPGAAHHKAIHVGQRGVVLRVALVDGASHGGGQAKNVVKGWKEVGRPSGNLFS